LQLLRESATLVVAKLSWEARRMSKRGTAGEGGEEIGILIPFPEARRETRAQNVSFERRELDQILRVYGRMVAANEWRDYAIDHLDDRAIFSVFRRTSETQLYQIVKDPQLARKQGAFSVVAAGGLVVKRGHELARVLGVFDKKLRVIQQA